MTEEEMDKFHRDASTFGFLKALLGYSIWILALIGVVFCCMEVIKFLNWLLYA